MEIDELLLKERELPIRKYVDNQMVIIPIHH